MNKKISLILKSFFILVLFTLSLAVAAQYQAPTAPPTGGEINPPINVGSALQYKPGILELNGLGVQQVANFSGPIELNLSAGSPGQALESSGGNGAPTWVTIPGSGNSQWTTVGNNIYNNNTSYVGVGISSPTNLLTINQTGVTTPASQSTYPLTINSSNGLEQITLGSDTNYSYLQSWDTKPLYINSLGNNVLFGNNVNVGIGTTSPGAKLEVDGNVLITNGTGVTSQAGWVLIGTATTFTENTAVILKESPFAWLINRADAQTLTYHASYPPLSCDSDAKSLGGGMYGPTNNTTSSCPNNFYTDPAINGVSYKASYYSDTASVLVKGSNPATYTPETEYFEDIYQYTSSYKPSAVPNSTNLEVGSINAGSISGKEISNTGVVTNNLYLNSNGTGYVGIGTGNPNEQLDVNGYINASSGLCIGYSCKTSWPASTQDCAVIPVGTSAPSGYNLTQAHFTTATKQADNSACTNGCVLTYSGLNYNDSPTPPSSLSDGWVSGSGTISTTAYVQGNDEDGTVYKATFNDYLACH
jgi:hypothetical protein